MALMYLIILFFFVLNHQSQGTQFSDLQKLELERQYNLLKKPSVKTIKTKHGDIYDCVDFYKQPAFDHPLLKTHMFHPEMRPSYISNRNKSAKTSSEEDKILLNSIKLNDGGCPTGTVPIRRYSKDDYIKIMQFTKEYASKAKPNANQQVCFDSNKSKSRNKGGRLSVCNLRVEPDQFTSGEFILQNGDDRLQVGYTVNPKLNKDNKTRMFQYIHAGQSHCFNVLCPGFISVRSDIPIDAVIEPVSRAGREIFRRFFFIYQVGWYEKDATIIGFWPRRMFTGMAKSASYVAIGGETYSPPRKPLPLMGSGYKPGGNYDTSWFARCVSTFVVGENYDQTPPQDTEKYTTNKAYVVADKRKVGKSGRVLYYGGPF
ncbi:hypothetical protein Cgig2_002425 [Carnegiea gigantea]|uniref:Neprosin PEP catalytic domain-containing protein n=1 Tax=Carnegiea gigantea TaxID=171969 RepID=A0A9Q1QNI4_9CARY|nr:hypothetical protein Cgig2_002425 [Carnegiea gigantea]